KEPPYNVVENIREYEFGDSVNSVLDDIQDMKDNPDKFVGIPTGIPELDHHMKGIMKSELGIIVAKTAGFKSTSLYNFAIESYFAGYETVLFTIEMEGKQILRRLYSRISNIPVTYLDEARVDAKDLEDIKGIVGEYQRKKKNKLRIVDVSEGCTTELIKSKLRQYTKLSPVHLVAVDYLQIIETKNGEVDLYDWRPIAIISRRLKSLCRLFNVSMWTAAQIVAGGQFRRGEDSTDDIAFSKAVSQNADIVIKI